VEVVPSTASALSAVIVSVANNGTALANKTTASADVGVGAAGLENELAQLVWLESALERVNIIGKQPTGFYAGTIASGSRLAVRTNIGNASTGAIVFGVPA
jgi:hypothetical protein